MSPRCSPELLGSEADWGDLLAGTQDSTLVLASFILLGETRQWCDKIELDGNTIRLLAGTLGLEKLESSKGQLFEAWAP